MSRLLVLSAALGGALLLPEVAAAQMGKPRAPREQLRASGTIKAMAPGGLIQLVTSEGETWVVKVDAPPENISYYADAQPSWLRVGMLVQLDGNFDSKGMAQSPLTRLAVVSPRRDVKPGVSRKGGALAGANLFADEEEVRQKSREPATVALQVVGQITRLKQGELTVAAPGALLRAELSDKAQVSVDLSNWQLAQVGDKIEVQGWYPPGMKGRAVVNRLTIRAAQPLGGRDKPTPPAKPAKADRKPPAGKSQPAVDPLSVLPD